MASKLIATILAGAALSVAAVPVMAEAQARHRVLVCKTSKHARNTGTAIGAVGGGLLGNAVAGHGNKTGGTLLGAGVGAVVGHQVAKKNSDKKDCHYEYRRG
jgi:uncharacterized protein YcfJ